MPLDRALDNLTDLIGGAWRRYRQWVEERDRLTLDRQFQPAVIELLDTPPSPATRVFILGLIAALLLGLAWSIFGRVDIIAIGQGKIIPTGRVKIIQPLEAGVVKALHVEDGRAVQKGDVLVELDLTQTEADSQRLSSEKLAREADVSRLTALIEGKPMPDFTDLRSDQATNQSNLFRQLADKHAADMAALRDELTQRTSEREDAAQQVQRLQATLTLMTGRSERLRTLVKEGFYARNRFDLDETERLRIARDLASQRQRQVQARAAMAATEQKIAAADADFQSRLLTELADKEDRRVLVTKELEKANQRQGLQTLRSPIAGTVQELKIHTIGGVVTPAQELMKIVPFQDALEAEVVIPNKDIGFVKAGQPVAIKLDAFPFTKYGLVDGQVKNVSLDAIPDEQLGLIYTARISLNRATIRVGDEDVILGPGLSISAEIKTGTRRIIEYFLSPLAEYAHDAIRER